MDQILENLIFSIIGVLLGGIVAILVSRWYYRKERKHIQDVDDHVETLGIEIQETFKNVLADKQIARVAEATNVDPTSVARVFKAIRDDEMSEVLPQILQQLQDGDGYVLIDKLFERVRSALGPGAVPNARKVIEQMRSEHRVSFVGNLSATDKIRYRATAPVAVSAAPLTKGEGKT